MGFLRTLAESLGLRGKVRAEPPQTGVNLIPGTHRGYQGAYYYEDDWASYVGQVMTEGNDHMLFVGHDLKELEDSFKYAVDGYLSRCERLCLVPGPPVPEDEVDWFELFV